MNEDRDKCIRAGMDDYISKPVHKVDLLGAIKRATPPKAGSPPGDGKNETPGNPGTDDGVLFKRLKGDKQKVENLLTLFKEELPVSLLTIEMAFESKNAGELKEACHGLRGMLLAMEMKKRASLAEQIELLAYRRKFGEIGNLLPLLKTEMEQAVHYLENSIK